MNPPREKVWSENMGWKQEEHEQLRAKWRKKSLRCQELSARDFGGNSEAGGREHFQMSLEVHRGDKNLPSTHRDIHWTAQANTAWRKRKSQAHI